VSERKRLADLNPNPRNPRKITEKKLEMLRKSLDEFGDLSGLVFNIRTQQLEGGHQRTKALPLDSDIIITQRYDIPTRTGTVAEGHVLIAGEKFKYREVDWDEDKAKAANIAANKHGGDWDLPLISNLLIELDHSNYNLDLTGYEQYEIASLLAPVEDIEIKEETIDLNPQFIVAIHCNSEPEMKTIFDEMTARGFSCKLIT
jgi:hypothetical protein